MSQTKVQLIAPIGVVTATTLETTGVLTATTFVGDIAGTVTGITSTTDNLNLGIITATSFAGDFTGIGSGLTGTPNVVAGIVTATKFVGNSPGLVSGVADGTNINAGIITATSFVGNITGNAAGLSTTTGHANLGIVTATSFHGSGANLEGVSSGPVAQQAVTANGSTTSIDLSDGNLIYMTQSANTTVSFANTEGNTDVVYLVRVKDATTTARTITWPSGMVWNGGTEPTLNTANQTNEGQIFKLTTRDNGATWYGVEVYGNIGGSELWVWGNNYKGALGLNSANPDRRSSPVQIPGLWSKIHPTDPATYRFFLASKTGSDLWGWGESYEGALGLNSTGNVSSPVQIPGTTWNKVDTGENYTLASKTDGTLWSWGYNTYGNLGQNNRTMVSSPIQIGSDTTWTGHVEAGQYGSFAIKTDGTLWAWGRQGEGSLGLNQAAVNISSPVQIPGTTWVTTHQQSAIKTDGTLWVWGLNWAGQLAQNDQGGYPAYNTSRSSPVQVPGTTWASCEAGGGARIAVKTDGTLWIWGSNAYGQLGQNSEVKYSSPVQVPGTDWSTARRAAQTANNTGAIKTDGTLWTWGNNSNGSLGQNNANPAKYSSPVQIPGTWSSFDLRDKNVAALKS